MIEHLCKNALAEYKAPTERQISTKKLRHIGLSDLRGQYRLVTVGFARAVREWKSRLNLNERLPSPPLLLSKGRQIVRTTLLKGRPSTR